MAKNNANSNKIGRYRLGLDLGTASIGWAIVELHEGEGIDNAGNKYKENDVKRLVALESYTFDEPTKAQNGKDSFELKNKTRRDARLIRRQVDRKKARSEKLFMMRELLNVTKEELDSVNSNDLIDLRVQALTKKIELAELLRVLMRLSKKRGYHVALSNDKDNVGKAMKETEEEINSTEYKTLGEVFKKHRDNNVKAFYGRDNKKCINHSPIGWTKLNEVKGADGKLEQKTFILRDLVKREFELIIEEQDKHHNKMFTKPLNELDYFKNTDVEKFIKAYFKDTDIDKDEEGKSNLTLEKLFHSAIFYQRPLKWDISTIGICSVLSTDEEITLSINTKFRDMDTKQQEQIKKRLCTTKLLPIYVEYRVESLLTNIRIKNSYIEALGYKKENNGCLLDADKDKLRKLILSREGVTYDDIYDELGWHKAYEQAVPTEKQEAIENRRFIVHDKRSKIKNDNNNTKKPNKKTKNNQNGYDVKGDVITPIFTKLSLEKEWKALKNDVQNIFMEFLSNIPNFELLLESNEKIAKYINDYVYIDNKEYIKEIVNFINLLKNNDVFMTKVTTTSPLTELGFPKANMARGSYSREFLQILVDELRTGEIEANIIKKHNAKKTDVNREYWGCGTVRPMNTITNLTNPVVKNAIKQLRIVLHDIVKTYGKPYQVSLEMARDMKNSLEQRKQLENNSKDMEKERNDARDELIKNGMQANARSIEKYILARWQNFKCAYTNNTIKLSELYDYEVDHIVPLASGGANSYDNKVLVLRKANNIKGDRMPLEAAENDSSKIFDIRHIEEMSNHFTELSKSKKETRQKKAWFKKKAESLVAIATPDNTTFNARQLTETNYIMKLASSLCHDIIDYENMKYDDYKEKYGVMYDENTGEVITIADDLIDDETDTMKNIDNSEIYLSRHRVIPTRGKLTSFLRKELGIDKVLPEVRGYEGKLLFTKSESKKVEDRIISWHDYNEFWDGYTKAKETSSKEEWDNIVKENEKYKNVTQYTFDKRCDHRHHAVDALVIALVDRRILQQAMRYNHENGSLDHKLADTGKLNKNNKPIYKADRSSNFMRTIVDNKLFSDYVYKKLRLDVVGKLIGYVPFRKLDRFPSDLSFFDGQIYTIDKRENSKTGKENRKILIIRKELFGEHFIRKDKKTYKYTLEALNERIVCNSISDDCCENCKNYGSCVQIKKSIIKQFVERYERFSWILKEEDRLIYTLGGYKLSSYGNIKSSEVVDDIFEKIGDNNIKSNIEEQYKANLIKYSEDDLGRYKKALDEIVIQDGIFFPEHTKNKVRKVRAYQISGSGYSVLDKNEGQKHLKNGGIQILANNGYACVEIKKDGSFEYITKREYLERYKQDLKNIKQEQDEIRNGNKNDKNAQKAWWSNQKLIFIGDIVYHHKHKNFYRINGINAGNDFIGAVMCTETISFDNGFKINNQVGERSKISIKIINNTKNIELILNKKELQKKIKEHQQDIFAKNSIHIPAKYQVNNE